MSAAPEERIFDPVAKQPRSEQPEPRWQTSAKDSKVVARAFVSVSARELSSLLFSPQSAFAVSSLLYYCESPSAPALRLPAGPPA